MAETTSAVAKKKGTAKTEQIIGAGASKLERLIKEYGAIKNQFDGLPALVADYEVKIAAKQADLDKLTVDHAEKKRQLQVEAEMAYKENKQTFVNTFAMENQLTLVPTDEYNKLKADLSKATTDLDKQINKEVAIVTNTLTSKQEAALKLKEAEFATKEANNNAEIKNSQNQIKFLETQVTYWKDQLDQERKAGIERAKAGAIGAVNVTSSK